MCYEIIATDFFTIEVWTGAGLTSTPSLAAKDALCRPQLSIVAIIFSRQPFSPHGSVS